MASTHTTRRPSSGALLSPLSVTWRHPPSGTSCGAGTTTRARNSTASSWRRALSLSLSRRLSPPGRRSNSHALSDRFHLSCTGGYFPPRRSVYRGNTKRAASSPSRTRTSWRISPVPAASCKRTVPSRSCSSAARAPVSLRASALCLAPAPVTVLERPAASKRVIGQTCTASG